MKALKLAVAAVAMTSSLAFAQGDNDKALHPTMGFCVEVAKKMDTDKNGQVSQAEFMQMVTTAWNKMDKGKRGWLTHNEAAQALLLLSGQTGGL